MSYNRKLSSEVWTCKHEEFCFKNDIPPSARLLWQWILKKGINVELEPDLKDFNSWISRYRGKKGYCRNTLKSALQKLIESRAINLLRRYTWNIVKIVARPIEYLKAKKKLQKRNIFDNFRASNSDNSVDAVLQQQLLINQQLYSSYGIHFDLEEFEVLNHPKNEILLSIICYQIADESVVIHCNSQKITRGKIRNPEGWIRCCLRKRYWDKPRTYQNILAKYGNTTFFSELFPED